MGRPTKEIFLNKGGILSNITFSSRKQLRKLSETNKTVDSQELEYTVAIGSVGKAASQA